MFTEIIKEPVLEFGAFSGIDLLFCCQSVEFSFSSAQQKEKSCVTNETIAIAKEGQCYASD